MCSSDIAERLTAHTDAVISISSSGKISYMRYHFFSKVH